MVISYMKDIRILRVNTVLQTSYDAHLTKRVLMQFADNLA